jgi:hypothetical protein
MQMNVSVIGEPTFHPTYPVAVVVNQRVEKSPSTALDAGVPAA